MLLLLLLILVTTMIMIPLLLMLDDDNDDNDGMTGNDVVVCFMIDVGARSVPVAALSIR
jgi:hypothetical protein